MTRTWVVALLLNGVIALNSVESGKVGGRWAGRLVDTLDPRASPELDRLIVKTAVPSMANLAVVPLVGAVDTFWVGRMGNPLAQAGQSAAGTTFFANYFLVSFIPTITAPLVAKAMGAQNEEEAKKRIGDALWVSVVLGAFGTLALATRPTFVNSLVVDPTAPAAPFASQYLRLRCLSMVPALISAVGFAAYRGLLDTVTPLKISLGTNLVNLILDPLLIFTFGFGVAGAAVATAMAEFFSAIAYLYLLSRRKLVDLKELISRGPPTWADIAPLVRGGAAVLLRQALLNVSFLLSSRRAQAIDPSGVSAAAYGIVNQILSLGVVCQIAVQGTAAALLPTARARDGDVAANKVADRLFAFGSLVACLLALAQTLFLPFIIPLFSTVPAVRQAIQAPAQIAALVQLTNGIIFAGEGILIGLGAFRTLAIVTAAGVSTMAAVLALPIGKRLDGILLAILAFHLVQGLGVLSHHLLFSPLAQAWRQNKKQEGHHGSSTKKK